RWSPSRAHCRRTLSSAWPGSTSARKASAEVGSFFFHPLQLHLESADLLVQLRLHDLGVHRRNLAAVGEHLLRSCKQMLLPAVNQRRMDAELAGQFVDRPIALEGRQGDLRLEGRRVRLPLTRHCSPLSWSHL